MAAPSTVVVVPCFNEADRLDVGQFWSFARGWQGGRFLFVDDGSTDRTPALLGALTARAPERFSVLALARNQGKAEAVRQGMLAAFAMAPAVAGYWDADLATPLEVIPSLEKVLADRPTYDIVMGSRVRLLGRSIIRQPVRHYVGRIFATTVSLLLRLAVYDTQCGAKLFRVSAATRRLFAQPFGSRWIFDVEALLRFVAEMRQEGIDPETRIYEFPLDSWRDMEGSKLGPQDCFRTLLDLARMFGDQRKKGR
jgi:dolichyl-phosphate beta-glucosyltransferase